MYLPVPVGATRRTISHIGRLHAIVYVWIQDGGVYAYFDLIDDRYFTKYVGWRIVTQQEPDGVRALALLNPDGSLFTDNVFEENRLIQVRFPDDIPIKDGITVTFSDDTIYRFELNELTEAERRTISPELVRVMNDVCLDFALENTVDLWRGYDIEQYERTGGKAGGISAWCLDGNLGRKVMDGWPGRFQDNGSQGRIFRRDLGKRE